MADFLKSIDAKMKLLEKAVEIIRNSRKREQETDRKKEEVWTRETSKTCWKAPGNTSRFKVWKTRNNSCCW